MAMVPQKDEAERLRLGVRGGWLSVDEVVAWADRQIEQASDPHPALIDLAMAHNQNREQVAALLDAVPGSPNVVAVMRNCLSDLLEVIEREPDLAADAARWLETAASRGELPRSEFGWEPWALAEAFALARQDAYGTIEKARERLLVFLRRNARREAK